MVWCSDVFLETLRSTALSSMPSRTRLSTSKRSHQKAKCSLTIQGEYQGAQVQSLGVVLIIRLIRDIIETLRMMVQEKNADELFQNAVWNSYAGDPSRAKQNNALPVSKDDAKADVDQGASSSRRSSLLQGKVINAVPFFFGDFQPLPT